MTAPEPVPEPVPETLLPALFHEVRRSQRRARVLVGLAAAAALLVVGAASVLVATAVTGDDAPTAAPSAPSSTAVSQPMTAVDQTDVQADVALTSVLWGTRLDLECSYTDAGLPPGYDGPGGTTYAMVVRSVAGDVEEVATRKALPGKTMHLSGATALSLDDIAAVEIRTSDGCPVLELAG